MKVRGTLPKICLARRLLRESGFSQLAVNAPQTKGKASKSCFRSVLNSGTENHQNPECQKRFGNFMSFKFGCEFLSSRSLHRQDFRSAVGYPEQPVR